MEQESRGQLAELHLGWQRPPTHATGGGVPGQVAVAEGPGCEAAEAAEAPRPLPTDYRTLTAGAVVRLLKDKVDPELLNREATQAILPAETS